MRSREASSPSPLVINEEGEGHSLSESQGDTSHGREAGRGDEADLVVAVVVGMAAAFIDGRVNPPTAGIVVVEDIVEIHAEQHFLHTEQVLLCREGISEMHVVHTEAWQRSVLAFGVVEVLS